MELGNSCVSFNLDVFCSLDFHSFSNDIFIIVLLFKIKDRISSNFDYICTVLVNTLNYLQKSTLYHLYSFVYLKYIRTFSYILCKLFK